MASCIKIHQTLHAAGEWCLSQIEANWWGLSGTKKNETERQDKAVMNLITLKKLFFCSGKAVTGLTDTLLSGQGVTFKHWATIAKQFN